jgi:hypothetical protein
MLLPSPESGAKKANTSRYPADRHPIRESRRIGKEEPHALATSHAPPSALITNWGA